MFQTSILSSILSYNIKCLRGLCYFHGVYVLLSWSRTCTGYLLLVSAHRVFCFIYSYRATTIIIIFTFIVLQLLFPNNQYIKLNLSFSPVSTVEINEWYPTPYHHTHMYHTEYVCMMTTFLQPRCFLLSFSFMARVISKEIFLSQMYPFDYFGNKHSTNATINYHRIIRIDFYT